MNTTLYVLLHLTMDVEEYLGVFVDLDTAKEQAAQTARERQNAELGSWKQYGVDAIHALTLDNEWNPTNYVIQPERITLPMLEYIAHDTALVIG